MVMVKGVLKYFGVTTMLLFAAIFFIKMFKEDEVYLNLIFGFVIGLVLFICSIMFKQSEK